MTGIACTLSDENTYDLLVEHGSMVIAETTPQNQAFLLVAHKGEYKEHPLVGIGIQDLVHDHDFNAWKSEIVAQLEADGQRITGLRLTEAGLTLQAKYK
ncbi:MAG: hypothetical protein NC038_05480 [Paludibacter sp.]|nr:hypothetical protein [Bacteroidales bacterium]MCM1069822.1 hypothetical protein [Prevotella sp.]MCM1353984.1 hypothetical protein [Bacteroides sp.]MCM1443374.1 hypothetical protein [Muribaculum sp.]MCM1482077.1 hypothetical protein [Paludibacter sp.]